MYIYDYMPNGEIRQRYKRCSYCGERYAWRHDKKTQKCPACDMVRDIRLDYEVIKEGARELTDAEKRGEGVVTKAGNSPETAE